MIFRQNFSLQIYEIPDKYNNLLKFYFKYLSIFKLYSETSKRLPLSAFCLQLF